VERFHFVWPTIEKVSILFAQDEITNRGKSTAEFNLRASSCAAAEEIKMLHLFRRLSTYKRMNGNSIESSLSLCVENERLNFDD